MPYRPSVVRRTPDVPDPGQAIMQAFDAYEVSRARKKAEEKDDFRFEREAEGHGFYREGEAAPPAAPPAGGRTPAGGGGAPAASPLSQAGPASTPDPGGLDFGGIGMSARPLQQPDLGVPGADQAFGAFMGAGPRAMSRPAVLPGEFIPGGGFASTSIYAPETPTVMGGQTYRRDASRTPEARAAQAADAESRRGQAEFQTRIEELVSAGVPENMAAAVSRDPTAARAFLAPPDEEPNYSLDDLVATGLPPALAKIVYGKPDLLEEILTDAQRAQLTRGTDANRAALREQELRTASGLRRGDTSHAENLRRQREEAVQQLRNAGGRGTGPGGDRDIDDLETAFDLLDRAYGEYDQWGELTGTTLDTRERFRLAEELVAGTMDPSQLPEPPVEDYPEPEDSPGIIDRFTSWLTGAEPSQAQDAPPPEADQDSLPPEGEEPQDDPQAIITGAQELIAPMLRRGPGGASPASIEDVTRMLEEEGFTPEEIEMIVQPFTRR